VIPFMTRQTNSVAARTRAARQGRRRSPLWFAPLAAAVGLCLSARSDETVRAAATPGAAAAAARAAGVSEADARETAGALCGRVTGGEAGVVQADLTETVSPRLGRPVRQWDVLCTAADTQYLVRIDADTGRVFAFNQLTPAAAASGDATQEPYTLSEAEAAARRYLPLIGIAPGRLRTVDKRRLVQGNGLVSWEFAYRTARPGRHALISVSVDAATGRLRSACDRTVFL
jgi:hypothetical protein